MARPLKVRAGFAWNRAKENFRDINVEKLDRHRGDPRHVTAMKHEKRAERKVVRVRSRQTAPFKMGTRGDTVDCDYRTRTCFITLALVSRTVYARFFQE